MVASHRTTQMYLGYRQYQLLFDMPGLGLLAIAVVLASFVTVLLCQRKTRRVPAWIAALLMVSLVQFYRGWMAPDHAWLPMLGALEAPDGSPGSVAHADFSPLWHASHENMRAADWWLLARTWNVCHGMWHQQACVNPHPSENAVGVAREIIGGKVTRFRASAGSG